MHTQTFLRYITTLTLIFYCSISFSAPPMSFDGELSVMVVDDFKNGVSKKHYGLKLKGEKGLTPIHFSKPPKGFKTGDKVKVKGAKKNKHIDVESMVMALDGETSSTTTSNTPVISGSRSVMAVIVDFQDVKASAEFTKIQIEAELLTNTQNAIGAITESSYHQVTFNTDSDNNGVTDVFGPVTIPYLASEGSCDFLGWSNAIDQALVNQGINPSGYDHRIYVLPHHTDLPGCYWAGLGVVGCETDCRVWISEPLSGMVYAHELGHNIGWGHSGTSDFEYGDWSGVMGSNRYWSTAIAPHREQLNWHGVFAGKSIEVTTEGVYRLTSLTADPSADTNPQIIKIAKPDTNEFYYLSYRENSTDPYTELYDGSMNFPLEGLHVHTYSGTGTETTIRRQVLEASPEQFSDLANNINIRMIGVGEGYVDVDIRFSINCEYVAPSMNLFIPTSASSLSVKYPDLFPVLDALYINSAMTIISDDYNSYTVWNNNTLDCYSNIVRINTEYPQGLYNTWPSRWDDITNFEPQTSAGATLYVGAYLDTPDGEYIIKATLADGLDETKVSPTYHIKAVVDNVPPATPQNFTATLGKGGSVILSWDPVVDNVCPTVLYEVENTTVPGDLTSSTSQSPSNYVAETSFVDKTPAAGENIYSLFSVDTAKNKSEISHITFVMPTKGGGKTSDSTDDGSTKGGGKKSTTDTSTDGTTSTKGGGKKK